MALKKYLSTQERSKILSLKKKGISVHAISREIHRSRATISKFIKNPEEYIKNIKTDNKYEILNNSLDKSIKSTKIKNDTTSKKSTASKITTTATTSTPASNKKIVRKNYDSSSKKKFSDDDIKRFNRVSVEYRAVIKYLIKKGIGPRFIYEDIKKVYGSVAPDLQSILYWAKQYQQGRQTIVNEPANKQNSSPLKTPISTSKNVKHITNTSKTMLSSPSKPVKLFKFKFKPVKRLIK